MKKKIVLVDMDGTIVDFRSSFFKEAKKNNWQIVEEKNKMHLKLKDDFDNKKRISISSRKGFYLNLEPIPGAVEAIKEILEDKNYDLFFCSTPSKQYKNCVGEKYRWIEKHFGFEATKKIILTRDKTLIKGDFLIDDKPEILGIIKKPEWEHIYFSQNYNKNYNKRRIDNWSDWRETLK